MKYYFFVLVLLISGTVSGQQRASGGTNNLTGKISGVLIDSTTNSPLPFAAVVVRNIKTEKDINGSITNEDGSFKISDVPLGSYHLFGASLCGCLWDR